MVPVSRARPEGHCEEQEQAREPQAEMRTPGHRVELMQPACLDSVVGSERGRIEIGGPRRRSDATGQELVFQDSHA